MFCIFCGTSMGSIGELQDETKSLRAEIRQARHLLLSIENRLSAIERIAEQEVYTESRGDDTWTEPTPPEAQPVLPQPTINSLAPNKEKRTIDWEQALPGNWLSRIGIAALFFGIGFLVKLAFDNDWISPVEQMILVIIIGMSLLGAGQFWNKRYRVWSQTLTGGGIAILYLAVFAGYALHDILEFLPAFGVMFLITITAAVLALRQESMAIAILGIIGAFITPVILGAITGAEETDNGNATSDLLIGYTIMLDLGILGLATFRNWRWFTLLGLMGSIGLFLLWHSEFGDEAGVALAQGALTIIFLIFVAATTLFHLLWQRKSEPADLLLMSLNAAFYFGISYSLLWEDFRDWVGIYTLALALFYGILGYVAVKRRNENDRLHFFAFGLALVFLSVFIPIQLADTWIAAAWAAEGAVLMWLSLRLGISGLRLSSLIVFGIVLTRLFFFEATVDQETFQPILNDSFLAFATSIIAFSLSAYFLKRDTQVSESQKRWMFPLFACIAGILSIWMLSAEIVNFFGKNVLAQESAISNWREIRDLENARNVSLIAFWLLCGLGLCNVGIVKRAQWTRLAGFALIGVSLGMVVTQLNYAQTAVDTHYSKPVLNYSFAAFATSIAALYVLAHLLERGKKVINSGERWLFPASLLAANILSIWMLSAEVVTFLSGGIAKSMGLTILWAFYALILIILGIVKHWRRIRLGGLALLCIAIFKLFVIDTFTLEKGYRVAAFLTIGIILLASGFAYQRFGNAIKKLLF